MATDNNKYYNNYDSSVEPKDLAYEISEQVASECDNLEQNKGTTGNTTNCSSLNEDLIPALVQVYYQIKNGNINIYANEDSKCSDDDKNPTIASILSRILRFDEAISCILCTYDPYLMKLLKSGEYPQVLMGTTNGAYPRWRSPDDVPTENSKTPITSGGVYAAIQKALLSTFHKAHDDTKWVAAGGDGSYAYYADDLNNLKSQKMDKVAEGDKALVKSGANGTNQEYIYTSGSWVAGDVLGLPYNYAVVEIEKGEYEDKEIYFLKDSEGNITWNLLDATVKDLEDRISVLEKIYDDVVLNADSSHYLFGVKNTLAEANAVPATTGKQTITLVIGGV